MPYALVRGARNTMPIAPRRWRRGLGQSCDSGILNNDGSCFSFPGDTGITQVGGSVPFDTSTPVVQQSTNGLLNPGAPGSGNPDVATGAIPDNSIGSSFGCAPGYVVADRSGNCAPAASLAASLNTAAGASSLGLSPSQAQAILGVLNTATNTVKAATGQSTSYVAPPSSNPFASISSTVWIAAAAGLALLLVLKSKR